MDLAKLIRRVGAEHCAFGTNFPLTEFDHDRKRHIEITLDLPLLSDQEKRMILSATACASSTVPIPLECPQSE